MSSLSNCAGTLRPVCKISMIVGRTSRCSAGAHQITPLRKVGPTTVSSAYGITAQFRLVQTMSSGPLLRAEPAVQYGTVSCGSYVGPRQRRLLVPYSVHLSEPGRTVVFPCQRRLLGDLWAVSGGQLSQSSRQHSTAYNFLKFQIMYEKD